MSASRAGSGGRSPGGGRWRIFGDCSVRWNARTTGSWRSWTCRRGAGDATPDGVQRLLSSYRWDADLVRNDLKDYVVEHLAGAEGVLAVDETGFLKKGD